MSSKPKKAAPEASPSDSEKAAAVDGVERARMRRLARAGFGIPGRCALLGIALDTGPRANPWHVPVQHGDDVVSRLALAVMESGVPPKALRYGATRLRKRGEP